jgi:hypothetical protein
MLKVDMENKISLEHIEMMLTDFGNKQKEMDNTLKNVCTELNQLKQTVIGNYSYGQVGLVKEITDIKKYVEKDKMFKNKLYGGLTVVGIGWTILLQYIGYLFKK